MYCTNALLGTRSCSISIPCLLIPRTSPIPGGSRVWWLIPSQFLPSSPASYCSLPSNLLTPREFLIQALTGCAYFKKDLSQSVRGLRSTVLGTCGRPPVFGGGDRKSPDTGNKKRIKMPPETSTVPINELSLVQLIEKKRDGKELTHDEIQAFVDHTVRGTAQDCQLGAMLMAMHIQGLTDQETFSLTKCMMNSGEVLSWPKEWSSILVDKHSTGGVGDKISLVLAPALAACGLKVPMISGRGLDFTGGTLDKLESIPGYKILLNHGELTRVLYKAGCFIAGQSANLVPADMELYKRRDVTATVPNPGLITGSILSKKAAEGVTSLIMDIKVGKAAFKKTVEEAEVLASKIVNTSKILGLKTRVALTRMDSVLGYYVGNSLEVIESVQTMKGEGPKDISDLVEELGGHLLEMCGVVKNVEEGKLKMKASLHDGSALKRFHTMMTMQGVDPVVASKVCDDPWSVLPVAPKSQVTSLMAEKSGVVASLDGLTVGKCCRDLGAGRMTFSQKINPSVGVRLLVKEGDKVELGKPWIEVHHSQSSIPASVRERLQGAIEIDESMPVSPIKPIVIKVL